MRRRFLASALPLLAIGCGAAPRGTTTAARLDGGWRTQRAEHRVALDVTRADGTHERRTLRGAIAVERPGKFRLRALGPAGITLFDIVSVDGRVRVVEAIRDPRSSALGPVIRSLAGDLQAAYALEPAPAGRTIETTRDTVTIREPDRTVRLTSYRLFGDKAVPLHIAVAQRALGYTVAVEVSEVELDAALDPALFAE